MADIGGTLLKEFYNENTKTTEKWYQMSDGRYYYTIWNENGALVSIKDISHSDYTIIADAIDNDTYTSSIKDIESNKSNNQEESDNQEEPVEYTSDNEYTVRLNNYENIIPYSWIDLDDVAYNNHFINGQCYVQVSFNRTFSENDDAIKEIRLPIYPEDITFGANTNYASTEIIGRPGTIAGYVSTGDVTTRINLHLHRELQVPGVLASDKNQIDDIVARIQACCYPRTFQNGLAVPIVTYVFGDTRITGKQTSFSTKWGGPKINNAYMDVMLDIAISHVPDGIIFFDDVRKFNPRQFV